MAHKKFDETDRRAAIAALEQHLNIELTRVGARRKWFRDRDGRHYWVLGGYGEWHGVPEEMMHDAIDLPTGGFVVVATRQREAIKIYIGDMSPIVANRDKLYRASKISGDYQFTFTRRGTSLFVNQVPSAVLHDLTGFSFTEAEKAGVARTAEVERLIAKLNPEERAKLLRELEGDA